MSIVGGEELITNGEFTNIFNGDTRRGLHLGLNDDKVFSFEIDFKPELYESNGNLNYLYGGLKNLGLVFESFHTPKEVEFVIFDQNGVSTVTSLDIIDNTSNSVWLRRNSSNGLAKGISKIIIRLKGQRNTKVQLSRVYASSFFITGNRYLSNQGGKLLGEIDLVDNYLSLGVKNVSPAASEVAHRRFIIINTGSGDCLMVCLQNENGEYYWKEL